MSTLAPADLTGLAEAVEGHFPVANPGPLFAEAAQIRERRLVAFALAPHVALDRAAVEAFVEVTRPLTAGASVDVFLDGGAALSLEGWRLVSFLHEHFDRYAALLPFASSPAMTLVALGANELVMTDVASLAPLAPPDLSPEARALPADLEAARRLMGQEQAQALLPRLLQGIDVHHIGRITRGWKVVRALARAALETHMPTERGAERLDAALDALCSEGLPPDLPLTRRDCEGRLGLPVVRPDDALSSVVWRLHGHYRQHFAIEGDWRWNERHFAISYDGFIETASERRVLLRVHRTDERGRRGELAFTRWVRPGGQEVVMDREVAL